MTARVIRVELNESQSSKLDELKQFYGVRSDAEIVRVTISETHRKIHSNDRPIAEELKDLPLIKQLIEKYDKVIRSLGEEKNSNSSEKT